MSDNTGLNIEIGRRLNGRSIPYTPSHPPNRPNNKLFSVISNTRSVLSFIYGSCVWSGNTKQNFIDLPFSSSLSSIFYGSTAILVTSFIKFFGIDPFADILICIVLGLSIREKLLR
jgi:hypothetical protein